MLFDAIFCANLLAYLIPSNVGISCEAEVGDEPPSTVADDGNS